MTFLNGMKHENTIKFISKHPNTPWFFALLIPSLGFLLEFTSFKTAFPRSGAILVVFAVIIVYLNHFVLKADAFISEVHSIMINPENRGLNIKKTYFNGKETYFQSEEEKELREQVKVLSEKEIKEIRMIQESLTRIELFSGATGTVIWGFGDLLFKYPTCC